MNIMNRTQGAQRPMASFLLASLFLVVPLGACSSASTTSSGTSTPSASQPWTRQFTLGNFSVNSAAVVTNEDAVTGAYVTDYVNETALPNANPEFLSVNAYIPSDDGFGNRVTNVQITVGRVDGSRTGDIFQHGEYTKEATVGGKQYSVYNLTAFTNGTPPLTRATFANVVFTFDLAYLKNDEVQYTAKRTIEIYKR